MGEVGVAVDGDVGPGQAAAVDDRGVVALVAQDPGAGTAEGGQHAQVGGVAGGEQEGGLGALPVGQLRLQLGVHRPGAGHQPGRSGPGAPAVEGVVGGGHHRRVLGQAEVVVGGEGRRRGDVEIVDRPPPAGGRDPPALVVGPRPPPRSWASIGGGQDVDDALDLGRRDGERGHEHHSVAERPQQHTGPHRGGAHLPVPGRRRRRRRPRPSARTGGCRRRRRAGATRASSRSASCADRAATLSSTPPFVEEPQVAEGDRRGQGVAAVGVTVGQVRPRRGEGVGHPAGRDGGGHGQVAGGEALAQAEEVGPDRRTARRRRACRCGRSRWPPRRSTSSTPVSRQAPASRANDVRRRHAHARRPLHQRLDDDRGQLVGVLVDHVAGHLEVGVVVEAGRPQHREPQRVEERRRRARRRPRERAPTVSPW